MKATFLFLISILAGSTLHAQPNKAPSCYFVRNNTDTTFCTSLAAHLGSNAILKLEYTDMTYKKVVLKGREIPDDITSLSENGIITEKIPLRPQSQNLKQGYVRRLVDGKLIVYDNFENGAHGYSAGSFGNAGGVMVKYVKLPDGTCYTLNKRNNENIIVPYLLQCAGFAQFYKPGEDRDIIEMIRTYNKFCK